MQVLFEHEQRSIDALMSLKRNMSELGDADEDFAKALTEGILAMEQDLKDIVTKHAPEWRFEKMDPIARPVLLLGVYELLFANDAPPAVVMNECIELAKEYGTEETGKFVNGVLNAVAKQNGNP